MLKVEKYEFVRIGYRFYGLNKSKLARETGHSRNTIRKAEEEEYTGYKKRCYQPFPVMEPYTDTVDSWLEEDKERHSKQRHTARRVYHRLVKEYNFSGSAPLGRAMKKAASKDWWDLPGATFWFPSRRLTAWRSSMRTCLKSVWLMVSMSLRGVFPPSAVSLGWFFLEEAFVKDLELSFPPWAGQGLGKSKV